MFKERVVEVPGAFDFRKDDWGKGFVGKILEEPRLMNLRHQPSLFMQLIWLSFNLKSAWTHLVNESAVNQAFDWRQISEDSACSKFFNIILVRHITSVRNDRCSFGVF